MACAVIAHAPALSHRPGFGQRGAEFHMTSARSLVPLKRPPSIKDFLPTNLAEAKARAWDESNT